MTGFFAAFIIYLGFIRTTNTPEIVIENAAPPVIETESRRGDFEYFDDLPNMEVKVDVEQVAERASPAPAENSTRRYLLQAGSFRNPQDAESRRAEITLLNLEARVVPALVNGQNYFRVQLGPFTKATRDQAIDVLAMNNIETSSALLRR